MVIHAVSARGVSHGIDVIGCDGGRAACEFCHGSEQHPRTVNNTINELSAGLPARPVISPIMPLAANPLLLWFSGLLCLFYSLWRMLGLKALTLEAVTLTHAAAAFAILAFLVAHLYLALTMSEEMSGLKAMLTGYREEESDPS